MGKGDGETQICGDVNGLQVFAREREREMDGGGDVEL